MSNDKMRGRIAALGEEISRLNKLVTDLNEVNSRNTELAAETDRLTKRVGELQGNLDAAQNEIASLHTPAELSAAQTRIETLTAELDRTRSERDDAVTAIDTALSATVLTSPAIDEQVAPAPSIATATLASADLGSDQASLDDMTLLDTDLDTSSASGIALASSDQVTDGADTTPVEASFVVQLGAFQSRTGHYRNRRPGKTFRINSRIPASISMPTGWRMAATCSVS